MLKFNKAFKILLGIYLCVGLISSLAGFATHTVLGKADKNVHYDHVYEIKQAYLY
jgi:hypothetical protein